MRIEFKGNITLECENFKDAMHLAATGPHAGLMPVRIIDSEGSIVWDRQIESSDQFDDFLQGLQ